MVKNATENYELIDLYGDIFKGFVWKHAKRIFKQNRQLFNRTVQTW